MEVSGREVTHANGAEWQCSVTNSYDDNEGQGGRGREVVEGSRSAPLPENLLYFRISQKACSPLSGESIQLKAEKKEQAGESLHD